MTDLITTTDLIELDGEPRIQDIRLAHIMGFSHPRQIRRLIKRYASPMERFGNLYRSGTPYGEEYYLNRRQALFLATKSGAPAAAELTVRMVEVFDAWLSSRAPATPPALPPPAPSAGALEPLLSPQARAVLRYRRLGLSVDEVCRLLAISPATVGRVSQRLRAAGLLEPRHG